MTNPAGYAFVPDDTTRVPSDDEAFNYDDATNPAIVYPDSWTVPDGRNELGETALEAHPRLFYKPEPHLPPVVSDTWRANSLTILSGGLPVLVLGPNPKRRSVTLNQGVDSAGSDGTGNIYVGPSAAITPGPNGGGYQLPIAAWSGMTPVVLYHTGAIYACVDTATANPSKSILTFVEESYP